MLHAFTLVIYPFYAARFISTVRLGGKKPSETERVEYRQWLFKHWSVVGESQTAAIVKGFSMAQTTVKVN